MNENENINDKQGVAEPNQPLLLRIAIPTYNRSESLARTLASLVPQVASTPRCVIEIYDNASNDGTFAIVKTASQGVTCIRYYASEKNLGANSNIIKALKGNVTVTADYVWLLSDHMLVRDGAVARIAQLLQQHAPDAVCAGISDYNGLNLPPDGSLVEARQLPLDQLAALYFHHSNISSIVVQRRVVENSACTIESCCALSYPHLGIWQRLYERGRIGLLRDISTFDERRACRRYPWFRCGVLGFGSSVKLVFPSTIAPDVLCALLRVKPFRNTIVRYIVGSRAGIVGERVDASSVREYCALYPQFILSRLLISCLGRMPKFPALWVARFLGGKRRFRDVFLSLKTAMIELSTQQSDAASSD